MSAVRRAALMTSDRGKAAGFALSAAGIKVTTQAKEVGESETQVAAVYHGADVGVVLNPDYVGDFLRAAGAESVEFQASGPRAAVVMRSAGDEYTYLVMPLNAPEE